MKCPPRGLYVLKHGGELANAPAHSLFERLKVKQQVPGDVAHNFDAYSVRLHIKSFGRRAGRSVRCRGFTDQELLR